MGLEVERDLLDLGATLEIEARRAREDHQGRRDRKDQLDLLGLMLWGRREKRGRWVIGVRRVPRGREVLLGLRGLKDHRGSKDLMGMTDGLGRTVIRETSNGHRL